MRPAAIMEQSPWDIPWTLLLSGDPSRAMVERYLYHGRCWTATVDGTIIGEIVVSAIRPRIWEIMNVAVDEPWQRQGIAPGLLARRCHGLARTAWPPSRLGPGTPVSARWSSINAWDFASSGWTATFSSAIIRRQFTKTACGAGTWCDWKSDGSNPRAVDPAIDAPSVCP